MRKVTHQKNEQFMIEVENLSKNYGNSRVVNDVSFRVKKGEIVGFLGPNGAGKTTAMRMLCCFLAPSQGTARIAGFDILENSLDVRRSIGYLPENAPLYQEMSVRDYLSYVAVLRGVPKSQRAVRLEAALDAGKLEDRADTLIRKLSKGLKQRVGIAQAIIHDPPVLILDEPSSGLDPRQRAETRALIKSLASEHTILLSTHILPDVQETCSRVIVIHEGKIVAQEPISDATGASGLHLVLARPSADTEEKLRRVAGVGAVSSQRDASFFVELNESRARETIAHLVVEQGWGLLEMAPRRADLEERFLQLTTRSE
ncbi:ABC-2 type transport system ATP-binding protein [Abditibacterium utsteinense]|uniref:ABC-2 type transport system ATP-binding protein n=2 Tax=Abditibacterium utsteinense TaxID=1960156 RepID=A0A2S8SXN4_9BACT|nr:ABC-2 type transport system ATP-binding protein [Abditibacterium utsteinense]